MFKNSNVSLKLFEYSWYPTELPHLFALALCTPQAQGNKSGVLTETRRPPSSWSYLPPGLISITHSQTPYMTATLISHTSVSLHTWSPQSVSVPPFTSKPSVQGSPPCGPLCPQDEAVVLSSAPHSWLQLTLCVLVICGRVCFPTNPSAAACHLHRHIPVPSILGTNKAVYKCLQNSERY